MKEISFIDGETSEIHNNNVHKKTVVSNENVSMELKYISVDSLSYILAKDNSQITIRENTSLDDLTTSIVNYGILEPIIVYQDSVAEQELQQENYIIIDGEKRVEAAIRAGKREVLAIVMYNMTSNTGLVAKMALHQKVFNSPLKVLNLARELRNITETYSTQDFEKFFNLDVGEYSKLEQFVNIYKQNKFTDLKKDVDKLYFDFTNGKITIDDVLSKYENLEKKQAKAEQKQQEEIQKLQDKDDNFQAPEEDNSVGGSSKKNENQISDLTQTVEQENQQFTGERQILDASIAKQLYARDSYACAICGYGGKKNPAVAGQLEKHHIVDVQYGGKDNIDNLVLLCPNHHKLVTKFKNNRADSYSPTKEDLQNNPQDWGSVVLGNMGKIARQNAIMQIKNESQDLYVKILKGNLTVGQALGELKLNVSVPKQFKNNPYGTFENALFQLVRDVDGFELFNHNLDDEYQKFLMTSNMQADESGVTDLINEDEQSSETKNIDNTNENMQVESQTPTIQDDTQQINVNSEQVITQNNFLERSKKTIIN